MLTPVLLALLLAAGAVADSRMHVALQADGRARADSISMGRVTVSVPARRADTAAVTARVARRHGDVRLVEQRTVLGRGGEKVVYVFEMPSAVLAGKKDVRDEFVRGLGRTINGKSDEVRRVRAKGKPVNLPIFESDWDAPTVRRQPAMVQTAALAAQAKATGRGQIVAVLDGGFDLRHAFLAGHLSAQDYDALDNDDDPQDLGNGINDDAVSEAAGDAVKDRIVGHGTFVSSLILSVAPDVTILPIRVLDDEGWGTDLSVACGISYAVANGAKVVNLSLVLPEATSIVKDAIRAAAEAGVVIVSASGTTTDGWKSDPYLTRRSICVGATDADDVIASWSLTGDFIRVYAPGVALHGAIGGATRDSYGRWDGVSFAVPFLSAGAAMIRQKHPSDWTVVEVRDRLAAYVDPVYETASDPLDSRGRVDLDKSVPAN